MGLEGEDLNKSGTKIPKFGATAAKERVALLLKKGMGGMMAPQLAVIKLWYCF